jgi:hypothetical protein
VVFNGKRLSTPQVDVLEALSERGKVHSGRGGYSATGMHALERRGLVRVAKRWTWETDWILTNAGRPVADAVRASRTATRARVSP